MPTPVSWTRERHGRVRDSSVAMIRRALARVFERVAQQVDENLLELLAIALQPREVVGQFTLHRRRRLRDDALQFLHHLAHDVATGNCEICSGMRPASMRSMSSTSLMSVARCLLLASIAAPSRCSGSRAAHPASASSRESR